MTLTDVCIILATLLGPILAVQAQKWLERFRADHDRKMSVFGTLMTTRATRAAPDHVRALNSIDLVFESSSEVVKKWREYSDSLTAVDATTHEKFIDLLFEMSKALKFNFDKVMLRRVVYHPLGLVDAELQQQEIQTNLGAMLKGQQEMQKQMLEYLKGQRPLLVKLEDQQPPV